MRIAINGFGRIGRNFLRTILCDPKAEKKIDVVAINVGPANPETIVHLFKYDTIMGKFAGKVKLENTTLHVGRYKIKIIDETDISCIDWKTLDIDWVVECTGCFTHREGALAHLNSGARHVLISAPGTNEDVTIIPGVNNEDYDAQKDKIVSLGSCTTNALAIMVKIIHDAFTLEKAFMTTVHSYTNSQVLLDVEHKDLRRARAAALNIIPTSTGAIKGINAVMPELKGKIKGHSIRVPVANVSLIDLSFIAKKELSEEKINKAFADACVASKLKGMVGITMEPLVSSDFNGMSESVILDGLLTQTNGTFGHAYGWYDNEWGYSMRMKDFLMRVA